MAYSRVFTKKDGGLPEWGQAGVGLLANPVAASISADSNQVITPSNILGGLILRSGATAARTDTTDTGTNLAAALDGMDIGDSHMFVISVQVAFAITIAGGTDVTASGNLVIGANGYKHFVLTKTGATTFDLVGL